MDLYSEGQDQDSEPVATAGERVMLVYPMRTDSSTGTVHMRLKRCDPVTATLTYTWVCVCSGENHEVRSVGNFSLVA